MKPKSPFIQAFEKLPGQLPIYTLENALLPGGELPLELSGAADFELFHCALKTDQLIGMIQPRRDSSAAGHYQTGCAGRIRQYRERKDGHLNVMLTGVCRYRLVDDLRSIDGCTVARVDWSGFENDFTTENVDASLIDTFKKTLLSYFDRHRMQVDWEVLDKRPIEEVVNNLVLVMNLDIDSKQRLLESHTVTQRLALFSHLLETKLDPIPAPAANRNLVN